MSSATINTQGLFINNEWRPSTSGKSMPVVNPATEEVIAEVASADKSDVDAAVEAARAALNGPWSVLSARERGRLVRQLGERLMARADEIARLETLHNGKPISESRHIEIPAAAECFEYDGGWSDKVMGETIPVKGNYLTYTLREPVGVVAAIVPWNFPLLLAAWKVAPALACGNTVILKPASQTPLTALALAELALEAGFPPGVLNVVTGPGSTVGQALVEHPGIDKIAFTGDTSTGKGIMRSAAATLKKITLELGGKSPNIGTGRRRHRGGHPRRDRGHFLWQGRGLRGWIAAAGRPQHQGRVRRQAGGAREEDDGRGSDGPEDALWRDLVAQAARDRAGVHRIGKAGRGHARRRRRAHRHRDGQGLLPAADRIRRRHRQHANIP